MGPSPGHVAPGNLDAHKRPASRAVRRVDLLDLEPPAAAVTVDLEDPLSDGVPHAVLDYLDALRHARDFRHDGRAERLAAFLEQAQQPRGLGDAEGPGGGREAVDNVIAVAGALGLGARGIAAAGVPGPKGNQEYFVRFGTGEGTLGASAIEEAVR